MYTHSLPLLPFLLRSISSSSTSGSRTDETLTHIYIHVQIGFLTEWQLYAQKIEGDAWVGEKLDPSKIEKMSGKQASPFSQKKGQEFPAGENFCNYSRWEKGSGKGAIEVEYLGKRVWTKCAS